MRLIKAFFLAFALWGVWPAVPVHAEGSAYSLGALPYLPLRELEQVFSPIAAELSRHLGVEVRFRSASTYESFNEQILAGIYDIAFVQPFDYVVAHDSSGYEPVGARANPLAALFVATSAERVPSLQSLRGKMIAMPPSDAAVSQLALSYLKSIGLRPGVDLRVRHFKSHMSCMHQLLIDGADACATAITPLNYFQKKMNITLHVVDQSPSIMGSLFVLNSRLPDEHKRMIRQTILGLSGTPQGKKLLEAGEFGEFVPVTDQDYDMVRRLLEAGESQVP